MASAAISVVRTGAPSRTFCVPSTMTCSPACRPAMISTVPGRRPPILTSRRAALPSSTTNTYCRSASGVSACSGMTSDSRSSLASDTLRNMPGRRAPSSLASSARTVTERVLRSTRESMLETLPAKVRPGKAGAVARTASPSRSVERKFSGTEKSSLMTLVSSSVVMTSPGLMSVPTLTRRRPTRPLKGARITVSCRRACAASSRARLALSVASSWSNCALDRASVVMSSRLRL